MSQLALSLMLVYLRLLDKKMLELLKKIKKDITNNKFKIEVDVIHCIIRPVLDKLGWDIFDVDIVKHEHPVGSRRVDIALFYKNKPVIFIEVKKIDGIDSKAEEQLLDYAFLDGMPMAILTDGREWHFYLPLAQVRSSERKFYKLDLVAREERDSKNILERYLQYETVIKGDAKKNCDTDYDAAKKDKEITTKLPQAWQELVTHEDDMLIGLLAEKVSDLCGYKPSNKAVIEFINKLSYDSSVPTHSQINNKQLNTNYPIPKQKHYNKHQPPTNFVYQGKTYQVNSGKDLVVKVIKMLFPDGDLSLIKNSTDKRLQSGMRDPKKFISDVRSDTRGRNIEEIYPGWYMDKDLTIKQFLEKIHAILDLLGINNNDLVINCKNKQQNLISKQTDSKQGLYFEFNNKRYEARSYCYLSKKILQILHKNNSINLQYISNVDNKKINTKARNFISKNIDDLYKNKDRDWTSSYNCEFTQGWYMGTNYPPDEFKVKIEAIIELSGISNNDLIINWNKG